MFLCDNVGFLLRAHGRVQQDLATERDVSAEFFGLRRFILRKNLERKFFNKVLQLIFSWSMFVPRLY